MIDKFYSKVYLPCSKQHVCVRQLVNFEFIQLQKFLLDDHDDLIAEYFEHIIATTCREKIDTESLSNIDKLVYLIKLRSISCGDLINFVNRRNIQASIQMGTVLDKIYEIDYQSASSLMTVSSSMSIEFGLPTSLYTVMDNELVFHLVKKIILRDNTIDLSTIPYKDKRSIIQELNSSVVHQSYNFIKHSSNLSTLVFQGNKDLDLSDIVVSPYNASLIEFLKFIFQDDLMIQYKTLYILSSKVHLDPAYLDTVAPIEQQIFTKFFSDEVEEHNKQLKSSQKSLHTSPHGQSI